MKVWIYFKSHFKAESISEFIVRAKPHISAFNPSLFILLIACISPLETIGKPASIVSIPNLSSLIAIWTFCSGVIETPGVCSPSLSVVSNILTFSPVFIN